METQYISLNMTPTGVNPCFHISQYDVGRMLGFIVHSGGATVDLDTYTCTIEATRSDGTAITSAVATTDNIGTFEVTPTMSNKADKYRCQLVIVDANSKRIASLPFDMEVTKAAMDENSEAIEEDASLYQQYTEAVQGAIAEANADIQAEASARQAADNTLQSNINAEASTRASADSNLQSQINQIVAPSGEAPSAAEVQNARIGADGVTYDTLGTAIRTQVSDLKSAFTSDIIPSISDIITPFTGKFVFEVGNLNGESGVIDLKSGTRLASAFVYLSVGTIIRSNAFTFIPLRYDTSKTYIGAIGDWTQSFTVENAGYYKLTARLRADASGSVVGKEKIAQNDIHIDPVATIMNHTVLREYNQSAIVPSNYSSELPDVDNAKKDVIYRITGFENGATSIPAGLPKNKWDSSWENAVLITFANITDDYSRVQIFTAKNGIFYRNYKSGAWEAWRLISWTPQNDYLPIVAYTKTAVVLANYQTVLPTADNATINTVYRLAGFSGGTSTMPSGLPKNKWDANWTNAILLTLGNENDIYSKVQLYITKTDVYYRNFQSGAWQAWVSISGKQNIIRVSALGAGDYTSFSEAIIAAFAIPNTIVYVDRGTYNVWDEMKAIMGNDYWDNLTEQTQYSYGLPWGNGMKIIGSPGAEIVFDGSQTSNDNTWYFFSPLMGRYVYGSDKTVSCEGLTFRVKNFRYAIHIDEGPINNDYTYIIKDCQFYCDNTGNPRTKASDAIGMGASINTTYIVENNYISASYAPTARDHENICFHNTNAASPKNKCRISNNYMDNVGTIRVDGYGDSLNKCKVQINGNSCGSALILPNPTTDNLECLVWNNEIRNN